MNSVNGPVYLEWSGTREGLIVFAGAAGRPVRKEELNTHKTVTGADLVVHHRDGVELISRAVDAVQNGSARSASVESDYGHVTRVCGVHAETLRFWTTADPAGHPVARLIPYAGGSVKSVAAVVGNVFDPLWYLDVDRPDRHAALEARFGLTPRWDGRGSVFRKCLTDAWRAPGPPKPCDFFTRMYASKAPSMGPDKAERVVGRYFVKCLVSAWRDASRPSGSEPFFDPKLLFDRAAVEAVGKGV